MWPKIVPFFFLSISVVYGFLPSPALSWGRHRTWNADHGHCPGRACQVSLTDSRLSRKSAFAFPTSSRRSSPRMAAESASLPNDLYDVILIGSGPASLSLASLLTSSPNPPKVLVCSKQLQQRWIPNYGAWVAEWEKLDQMYTSRNVPGLMDRAVDTLWGDTDCFFGEDESGQPTTQPEGQQRRSLNRPYLRVSREGLKSLFYNEDSKFSVVEQDVIGEVTSTNVFNPPDAVVFHPTHTTLKLTDGSQVHGKVVVDATGAESSFTIRDGREKEGYQIAYGVECHVEGKGVREGFIGDYDVSKMTLFDYRSEAWRDDLPDPKYVADVPTFNYVMPFPDGRIFFEETSLVAAPALRFQTCKDRLRARLAAQGVAITDVIEEEFCYIPMGGDVPRRGQRLVPVGAAAGVVHAATGFQICRALASNLDVCAAIEEELARGAAFDPDAAAARVLGAIWTPEAVRQRDFCVFGGDFLMRQNVEVLKGFFSGFFKLEEADWSGFLAGWKGLPNNERHAAWHARLLFGLRFLTKMPVQVGWAMTTAMVGYILKEGPALIQSVTPLLGAPEPFGKSSDFRLWSGDEAAKEEAMMLIASGRETQGLHHSAGEGAAGSASREQVEDVEAGRVVN